MLRIIGIFQMNAQLIHYYINYILNSYYIICSIQYLISSGIFKYKTKKKNEANLIYCTKFANSMTIEQMVL